MEEPDFGHVIDLIRKEDARYDKRAYFFLRDALDHTVKQIRKAESKSAHKRGSNHVTGPELLEGIRAYAVTQFGPMTHLVFQQWGISLCADFGEMVFQLIEHGVFSKTSSDRKEDFSEVFDFGEAFVKPFLPRQRRNFVSEVAGSESF